MQKDNKDRRERTSYDEEEAERKAYYDYGGHATLPRINYPPLLGLAKDPPPPKATPEQIRLDRSRGRYELYLYGMPKTMRTMYDKDMLPKQWREWYEKEVLANESAKGDVSEVRSMLQHEDTEP